MKLYQRNKHRLKLSDRGQPIWDSEKYTFAEWLDKGGREYISDQRKPNSEKDDE